MQNAQRGWDSSAGGKLGLLSCMMQPLAEGIFPLELTWVLTPFPKTLSHEYKPRSSLCIHAFHRTNSKDPDIHALDG